MGRAGKDYAIIAACDCVSSVVAGRDQRWRENALAAWLGRPACAQPSIRSMKQGVPATATGWLWIGRFVFGRRLCHLISPLWCTGSPASCREVREVAAASTHPPGASPLTAHFRGHEQAGLIPVWGLAVLCRWTSFRSSINSTIGREGCRREPAEGRQGGGWCCFG